MSHKNVYVIAGPNGAGKTTFAREFLPDYAKCVHFVNADLIAQGLSPFSPRTAAIKAGRLVLEQIHRLAEQNLIHLFFLWIPNVELALARIKERVADGGHDVPTVDVRRRFHRGIYNLFKFYKPLLDTWMLFNNSVAKPSLIAEEKEGKLSVIDRDLFNKIIKDVRINL